MRISWTLSQLVESRSQLVDSRFQLVDSRSQFVDSRSQFVDSRSKLVDSGSQFVDSVSQLVDSGSQLVDFRSKLVDYGSQLLQTYKYSIKRSFVPIGFDVKQNSSIFGLHRPPLHKQQHPKIRVKNLENTGPLPAIIFSTHLHRNHFGNTRYILCTLRHHC